MHISSVDTCKTISTIFRHYTTVLYSPFTRDRGISWHRFRRQIKVTVGPVEERLPPLWEVCRKHHAPRRARGALHPRTSARRRAILNIETVRWDRKIETFIYLNYILKWISWLGFCSCDTLFSISHLQNETEKEK